jgi:proteasome lid subunit RPN8/RPN11
MGDAHATPWVNGGLSITRSALARVYDEAVAAYGRDEESCGLLSGAATDPLAVDEVTPLLNRANKLHALDPETYPRTGRTYFDIDPMKFDREVKARAAGGRPVKVLYHSHLDVGAYFSETDAAAALGGGDGPLYPLAYLVTSVQKGVIAEHRLFVYDGATRAFVASDLTIVEGA